MSDIRTGHADRLDWLLQNLLVKVPGTRHALLLSSDGLKRAVASTKAEHGVDLDDNSADRLAALASGLSSLGRGVGQHFADGGEVRQVVVELTTALLFVSSAGSGAVLAVLAGPNTDPGTLGYEMGMLVKSVRPFLSTPARQPMGAPPEGRL
ncbi:roadblock/LC7 domain-containing protein [Streptomyces sp. Wb2n-11]|uniref:roadblock/LC7 domain-containing protein n=1 Tax=Streptomyces sp. Wb2n-11 TaxID=1030533 RepID=UPI000AEDD81B|nr:roadblock/LC7 domain-containing protein [Streptomyces sp. Wb2n-11]